MLNFKTIFNVLGLLLIIEGVAMALAIPVSLYYGESDFWPFVFSTLVALSSGGLMWLVSRTKHKHIGKREGYIIVSMVWIVFSFFGSLPFYFSHAIPSFTDCFFETMSGFTTTGASILSDIESMPKGILFWRAMTQWLGGMGIIVLSLTILPLLGIGGMQLFVAEVPGPTPDKISPKVQETAQILWGIYLLFTIAETIFLMIGGMSFYDAITHSFTTMATGGYSTKNTSIAAFNSPYIEYVITIFMFIAGANFTLAYYAMKLNFRKIWQNEEFKNYLFIVLIFTATIATTLYFTSSMKGEASFRTALFQVVSLITTTGFATADYLTWVPVLSVICFVLLFFGGSAGSTGGGVKIVRIVLLAKNSYMELKRLIHPNAIIPVRLNHKSVNQDIVANVQAFIVLYMVIFAASIIILSAVGIDLQTAMGAAATSLGNVGPGIGSVGPASNFAHLPDFGKWYLSFLMLSGRLELFTVMILFSPAFWKK